MLRGFYTIASGMLAQQRNIDLISNNLVNTETPGFRTERMLFSTFRHELMIRKEAYSRTNIGTTDPITLVADVVTLHQSGVFQDTGFAFDLAIDGPGYFKVQGNGDQPYVTRSGQFNMDSEGYLILANKGRVLSKEGEPIQVKNAQFKIADDGTVTNETGKQIGVLDIVSPPLTSDLIRLDDGLYQLRQGVEAEPSKGFRVVQGVVERSNVDYNMEMTTLLEAQRAFQSCSSALQMIDTMNRRAATTIAAL